MRQKKIREAKSKAEDVCEIIRMVEGGTGDGRIPASYRPLIKGLAEGVLRLKETGEDSQTKIYLEDDLVTHKDVFMALTQGCKIKNNCDDTVWLNTRGELCSTNGFIGLGEPASDLEWRVVGEYDWYAIGMDLADGKDVSVTCMCRMENGWLKDEIVGYAPKLTSPHIGKTKNFYSDVIVLSFSDNYIFPAI